MTVDRVNKEVAEFVNSGWGVHRVSHVDQDSTKNVTEFSEDEARILYNTLGDLHHETGHVIVEMLSKAKSTPDEVKEGWCDAYKYLRMQESGVEGYTDKDRQWFAKITKFRGQPAEAILATSSHRKHDITYGIPASRILRACKTLAELREMTDCILSKKLIDDHDEAWNATT